MIPDKHITRTLTLWTRGALSASAFGGRVWTEGYGRG